MTYQYHDESIIYTLPQNSVFVFGSDLNGQHSTGAAHIAVQHFGALVGIAKGWSGQSFAIPVLGKDLMPLSILHITKYMNDFKIYSKNHPNICYFITALGCGSAGHHVKDIAPLFKGISNNVILPHSFLPYIEDNVQDQYPAITRDFLKFILNKDIILAENTVETLKKSALSTPHQAIAQQIIDNNVYPTDYYGRGRVHEIRDIMTRLKQFDAEFNQIFHDYTDATQQTIGGVVLALMELYEFTEQDLLQVWQHNHDIQHPSQYKK